MLISFFKRIFDIQKPYFYLFLSSLIWIFCFRGFIFGKLSLESDALAYYGHFKFFIENLKQGVYPMWDPHYYNGVPIEFFLRRIGSFNPTYILILILNILGLNITQAYLIFLAFYYLLGMFGFYNISALILKDKRSAFLAFLLLTFSSLSTRLFDSYLLLVFVPMVWFFFFLIKFYKMPSTEWFLGCSITLSALLWTYIPFYFLTIFLVFIFCFSCLYVKETANFLKNTVGFIVKHKLITCFCVLLILLSFVPGYLFHKQAKQSEFVLPERNSNYSQSVELVPQPYNFFLTSAWAQPPTSKDSLGVGLKTIYSWGIEEDLGYSFAYSDFRRFKFAILYIPITAFIILILGLGLRISKPVIFFAFWGVALFFLCAHSSPFHYLVYKYIFFFKYFRNLHFFLWIALLPIFVLFVATQFDDFLFQSIIKFKKIKWVLWIVITHMTMLFFLRYQSDAIVSSYVSVMISFCFLLFYSLNVEKFPRWAFYSLLTFLCVLQPLSVYKYLQLNAQPAEFMDFTGASSRVKLYSATQEQLVEQLRNQKNLYQDILFEKKPSQVYMGIADYIFLLENFKRELIEQYADYKIIVYDAVKGFDQKNPSRDELVSTLFDLRNIALIDQQQINSLKIMNHPHNVGANSEIINQATKSIVFKKFNNNKLLLETNFISPKFLVYNDVYSLGWQVFVDGKKKHLFEANYAFKGVEVAEGKHQVLFEYGPRWKGYFNWAMWLMFLISFWRLIFILFKNNFTTWLNAMGKKVEHVSDIKARKMIKVFIVYIIFFILTIPFLNYVQMIELTKKRVLDRLLPSEIGLLINNSISQLQENQRLLDDSMFYFQKIDHFFPNSWDALGLMGYVAYLQNNLEQAKSFYQRSIQLNPHAFNHVYNLAGIYLIQGHQQEALKFYDQAANLSWQENQFALEHSQLYKQLFALSQSNFLKLRTSFDENQAQARQYLQLRDQADESVKHSQPRISVF